MHNCRDQDSQQPTQLSTNDISLNESCSTLMDSFEDKDNEGDGITFYQGFRAIHPKLSKANPVDQVTSSNLARNVSTHLRGRVPDKAKHHTASLHNISKLFTEILQERETLIHESNQLNEKKVDDLII